MKISVRVRGWWDQLRSSLWLVPTAGALLAAIMAGLLTRLEPLPGWVPEVFEFTGTPDGARAILAQLAGATVTVVGLVFSLTVIGLQMAATQFSPRLLRGFLRDRRVQIVLSAMIASAVYAVGVLRTVRSGSEGLDPFVPRLAVTVALLLSFAAVGMLIYYIHYVAQHLRVDVVMREIVDSSLGRLAAVHPGREVLPDRIAPAPPDDAHAVPARRRGFLQFVDASTLARDAREMGIAIRIRPTLGEWVNEGTTIAWAWPDEGASLGDLEELATLIHRRLHLGPDRSESTDLAVGLRQLQDVATRALSSGVNDPTTATRAVEQMSAILCRSASHPLGDEVLEDDGHLRLAVPRPGFGALVELAVGPTRRYATTEPDVLAALLTLLIDLAEHVADSGDRREVLRGHVERILRAATFTDVHDADRIDRAGRLAMQALDIGARGARVTEAN